MIAPPGIPNITLTPSASRERRIASDPFILISCPSVSRCLVPSPAAGLANGADSVAVCTDRGLCVSDVSLAGENVGELDAYAARCREARIAVGHGYGEAEHRLRSMPEAVGGRKPEALPVRGEGNA